MNKLVGIKEAAKFLGVSIPTLRRWQACGKLLPEYTKGKHRRYNLSKLKPNSPKAHDSGHLTMTYARVSCNEQRQALNQQKQLLENFCIRQGWRFESITDIGSGINYHKKGLRFLLTAISSDRVERLVIADPCRLLCFGAELLFALCEVKQVEVVILNCDLDICFEEDTVKDILEVVTVLSMRAHGCSSYKLQKLLGDVRKLCQHGLNSNKLIN